MSFLLKAQSVVYIDKAVLTNIISSLYNQNKLLTSRFQSSDEKVVVEKDIEGFCNPFKC